MTRALRAVSSEKGRDPRDFALIAYGGAGPVHAAGLAEELGMPDGARARRSPGSSAPLGLLFARPEFHDVRICHLDARRRRSRSESTASSPSWRPRSRLGRGRAEVEWARTADVRYGGQSWEVEVGVRPAPVDGGALAALATRFEDEHERLYGTRLEPGSPVEIRAVRLAALGGEVGDRTPFPRDGERRGRRTAPLRPVDGTSQVAVRTRASVGEAPGAGPLLVDEYDTTVVVPPGWTVRRDAATGTLVLERDGD